MEKKLFKSKKDQSDFFIALVVIALFLWLFYGKLFKRDSLLISDVNSDFLIIQDEDQDGIANLKDERSNQFSSLPNRYPAKKKGHIKETIHEQKSKSKNAKLKNAELILVDSIPEAIISTPQIISETSKSDADKDGIVDEEDKCPFTKGVKENYGCPSDRDNDGIIDSVDRCPDQAGVESNDGCPELKLEKEEQKIIQEAVQNVQFETANAQLKQDSFFVLDKIANLMHKYPKAQLKIEGHTDSVGDDGKNLELSKARANSCKNYLINAKNISKNRILTNGYGETQPKATNDTVNGRRQNRRVEFYLNY